MAQTYKPCLFQKYTANAPVRDSLEWGVYIKSVPFRVFPAMKDIPSRDWMDENGDEEFIPDKPVYKAYELDCEFVYIGVNGTANQYIRDFMTYLAEGGMFRMYDTYTKIGKTNVRYISYSEDVLYRKDGQKDIVIFTVKLKVNDPTSNIILTK